MKLFAYSSRDAQSAYIVLDKITDLEHHEDTLGIYLVGSTRDGPDITLHGGPDILAFFNAMGARGEQLTRMMRHTEYAHRKTDLEPLDTD